MFRRGFTGLLVATAISVTGCGSSLVKTEGIVKLDGTPVEGAGVTFSTEDGSRLYNGYTDSAGKFVLVSGNTAGALPGTYKVTVVKTPKVPGGESIKAGDPEYMKQMAKDVEKKGNPALAMYQPKTGSQIKSELPAVYALASTTPLTATVPSKDPIVLELKSKP